MRKKMIGFGIAAILAIAVFSIFSSSQTGQAFVRTIPAPSLQNNLIGEALEQPIAVYLPQSYESSEKRYPVVYFLPGYSDSYAFYGTEMQKAMDYLLGQEKIKDMIVVVVNGMNKLHGSYYVNSPVTGNWEDFVVRDTVRYVDQTYRTIPDSASRGIAGHSMGGFGAFHLAMRNPDVFSCVYSMSPGMFAESGLDQVDFNIAQENPFAALPPEEARAAYLEKLPGLQYPNDFAHAYGSAFSPDPEGKAPYIRFVDASLSKDARKTDPIWQAWNNGFGNWNEKIKTNRENLLRLRAIAIDYGKQDEYTWIPEGCAYVSNLLQAAQVPHELLPYEGNHMNLVVNRLQSRVLPYFSEHLEFE